MHYQLYQRQHPRSTNPAAKPYRFLKLPIALDTIPLEDELANIDLPWLPSQWKWHLGTYFCILRAGPRGEWSGAEMTTGKGVDSPILKQLPNFHRFLDTAFPVSVPLAWIGLSPPQSSIRLHIDNTPHWDEHHRIHIPLTTNSTALLCCEEHFLHLSKGTAWAFNNSRPHGACNSGANRIHLILDLPSTTAIESLLASGEAFNGSTNPIALDQLTQDPLKHLTARERANPDLLSRLLQQ